MVVCVSICELNYNMFILIGLLDLNFGHWGNVDMV